MKERIYKAIKTGSLFGEIERDGRTEINTETPIVRDLKKFKKVGKNNVFEIYEQR